MREVFKTHIHFGSYIWGVVVIIFIAGISYEDLQRGLYTGALLLFVVFALTWYFTFFFKRYWIEDNKLFIKSISGTKSVDIISIRKLETEKVDWFGTMRLTILRPYRKGMILHYNVIDDIFVDPENPTQFIDKLKQIAPSINVIEAK
ncbi:MULTISPECIES: PH domain-containing protein [Sphingobacterium]|uniref:PH domain-containing protein n=1 Tax=Sphingobacterium TaxID=28453 RepID=UPI00257E97F0|nr:MULTISPECIES: PH domain-containing protein [Sphingobacterium]